MAKKQGSQAGPQNPGAANVQQEDKAAKNPQQQPNAAESEKGINQALAKLNAGLQEFWLANGRNEFCRHATLRLIESPDGFLMTLDLRGGDKPLFAKKPLKKA